MTEAKKKVKLFIIARSEDSFNNFCARIGIIPNEGAFFPKEKKDVHILEGQRPAYITTNDAATHPHFADIINELRSLNAKKITFHEDY